MGSHFHVRFTAGEQFPVVLYPLRYDADSFPDLLCHVLSAKQTTVIAVSGIHELVVDMTKPDGP